MTVRIWVGGDSGPISGALIRFGEPVTLGVTDRAGSLIIPAVPPGTYPLFVSHLGYRARHETVHLSGDQPVVEFRYRLETNPIALDPVEVRVTPNPLLLDARERIAWMGRLGLGESFDRAYIENSGSTRLSHLLARIPGVRVTTSPVRLGGVVRLTPSMACDPALFIDRVEVPLYGATLDDLVPVEQLESVEVYRRRSTLPGDFASERALQCGAVAVYTRRASGAVGESFSAGKVGVMVVTITYSVLLKFLVF